MFAFSLCGLYKNDTFFEETKFCEGNPLRSLNKDFIVLHSNTVRPKPIFGLTWRILGECLLISSLPGKASRKLVESQKV